MGAMMDPMASLSIILFQIGNRYLKINLTKAQEEILFHPTMQMILYFMIIYYSTKSLYISSIVATVSYLLYSVLLNENHPYNLFPEKWLSERNLVSKPYQSYKENYKNNLKDYHKY